jgi:hypothetical protein
MAETAKNDPQTKPVPVAKTSSVPADVKPHDRVAMLSLKADGTPDQTDPEMIGDKEFAVEATKEQFAQRAVSALDEAQRAEKDAERHEAEQAEDPTIAEAKKAHEAAAEAAKADAEAVVNKLHKDQG